jgi:putative acetyltransferase
MKTRPYRQGEEEALWQVFHRAVHGIGAEFYSPAQLDAWSPDDDDSARWCAAMRELAPRVVEYDGHIVAYADLQDSGLITHFFVHSDWQRRGIGNLLMKRLHDEARERRIVCLDAQVSLAAEAFFAAWGFRLCQRQQIERHGVSLPGTVMQKWLHATGSD